MREEVGRLRLPSRAPAGASAAVVRRLKAEVEDARLELSQLAAENKSLRDRLQAKSSSQERELAVMEDRTAELKLQRDEACQEREELSVRVESLQKMLRSLESELQRSSAALGSASSEVGQLRGRVAQLQGLVEASERGRQQQERHLCSQADHAQEAQASISALTARIGMGPPPSVAPPFTLAPPPSLWPHPPQPSWRRS